MIHSLNADGVDQDSASLEGEPNHFHPLTEAVTRKWGGVLAR